MVPHTPTHPTGEGSSDSRYELDMFTLYFRDRKTEQVYVRDNMAKALPLVRISLFFAMLLYAVFGILDYRLMHDAYNDVWLIRFGAVCPVILAVLVSTFFPRFYFRHSQALLSACMAASGFGVVAMTDRKSVV